MGGVHVLKEPPTFIMKFPPFRPISPLTHVFPALLPSLSRRNPLSICILPPRSMLFDSEQSKLSKIVRGEH
jgi:hypothetical protein